MKKKMALSILIIFGFFLVSNLTHAARRYRAVKSETTNAVKKGMPKAPPMPLAAMPKAMKPRVPRDTTFNIDRKRGEIAQLVNAGLEHLQNNPIEKALSDFTHTKEFKRGELYLFVFDLRGRCLAHGNEENLLWRNLYDLQDTYGTHIVQNMINAAKKGGDWVTYHWRNATKVSHIKPFEKDGQEYLIGAGYYPHSKSDTVVNLVKGAVSGFKKGLKKGFTPSDLFSVMSYPIGKFIRGDLYLYALDEKGTLRAQGDRPGLIGTNSWEYKDARGKLVNQEIINGLKATDKGIWVDYISKNAQKKAYAEKVIDEDGNMYAIACGYYPDADRSQVQNLVKRGYQFMKTHGITATGDQFSSKRIKTFRYGDLFLEVYNLKGKCIAHGGNPELVGRNMWNAKSDDGRFFVREMVEQAEKAPAWLNFKQRNAYRSVYAEFVDLGIDQYIIASSLYPISKGETMLLLVKSGASFLETAEDEKEVFEAFAKTDGQYLSGDLGLFVLDTQGIAYVYGDEYEIIWQNLLDRKDDEGKPYIKMFINTAQRGAAKVSFVLDGVRRVAYVESIERGTKTYVVGSSYAV